MGKKAAQPLYKQIKARLKAQVVSGELSQGALLPSETELAERYSCSRLTVHRSLRELADEGVVERRRRAGTRVAMRGNTGLRIRLSRVTEEISRRGFAYRYELIKSVVKTPPLHIHRLLGGDPEQEHLHIKCLHWANNRVFQFEDRWVNLITVPKAQSLSFEKMSPSLWLLDNVPLSDLEHEISAISAKTQIANVMKVEKGSPILEVTRRSTWNNQSVSCARLMHPGDLYSLKSERKAL
ncbi:GntR family transcriptional regulator [Cochlodiniinecator piscidefendens]|uniref:GntR family transcriptional regulator n=1 Tax=Cochlodiniinecator piscidefendens TaxID=2715756 RepID=UPI00140A55A8